VQVIDWKDKDSSPKWHNVLMETLNPPVSLTHSLYIIILIIAIAGRKRAGPLTGCYFHRLTGKRPAVLLNRIIIHIIVNMYRKRGGPFPVRICDYMYNIVWKKDRKRVDPFPVRLKKNYIIHLILSCPNLRLGYMHNYSYIYLYLAAGQGTTVLLVVIL